MVLVAVLVSQHDQVQLLNLNLKPLMVVHRNPAVHSHPTDVVDVASNRFQSYMQKDNVNLTLDVDDHKIDMLSSLSFL